MGYPPLARRIAAALLFAVVSACSPGPDPARHTRRVVLVALDGAAWRVMDPLLAAGELPNARGLIARGCRGVMKSLRISSSARIWTSVASGVRPALHGIRNFTYELDGKRRLFTSRDVRMPRVWELASAAGVSVGVTNWWFTYPSAPLNGFLISDHTIPSRSERANRVFSSGNTPPPDRSALVHPPELWQEFGDVLLNPPLPARHQWFDTHAARALLIEDIRREDEQVLELALRAASAYPPRFQLIYFKGVDRASHRFWREYDPDHPNYAGAPPIPEKMRRYGTAVLDAYRDADRLLGRLLAGLADDDVVLLISDHGFEAADAKHVSTGTHGSSDASIDGIYIAAGGPISARHCPPEISLYDVAPTALYLLGVGIPDHMQGEVPPALFEPDYLAATPALRTEAIAASAQREQAAPVEAIEAERLERLRVLGYFEEDE
jgi:predicted AlkP superfamily phosphohydrolase/phosphomutase